MKTNQTLKQTLASIGWLFRNSRPGPLCPPLEALALFAAQELIAKEAENIALHVAGCEACQMVVMRLETDQYLWQAMFDHSEDTALAQALGKKGQAVVNEMIKKTADRRPAFVSKVKEALIAWTSPLWQPLYAGEAITAAAIEKQFISFDMDYGEYINLSCSWQEEKRGQAHLDLSWQANLLQPSKLWARFIDPDNNTILAEISLGKDLQGKIRLSSRELTFNPTTDKWAIALLVEE